ncbi:uncharacterized protein LOC123668157 [Melitaea cinxia]|uniref:uncharacterized protein LOC123668157 n=1 Tax=Melitaea cinxia TaxID=113334 RepID=UPI001E2715E1|nr:uncharacterized protein LOC123668157 [Melitaea cinxia]
MEPSIIFKTLQNLGISHMFVYRTINRYNISSVEDQKRSVRPRVVRTTKAVNAVKQDSAPGHKERTTQVWLETSVLDFIRVEDWPSSSPDLNPLDFKLWSVLEDMACSKRHGDIESLKKSLERAVAKFPLETVRKSIDQTGRYIVNLPIQKEKLPELGNSFNTAYRYLMQLEARFQKDTILHSQYKAFINEFVELGHAHYINKFSPTDLNAYYLPHFPIVKPEARSTKLRTVFHASSESSTGLSLNSILYEGPNIYNDLLDIILRFRLNQFVFSCDIIKMFRGISINPEQQSLQRVLWRETSTEPIKCLELTTVTYGTKCAPYLACRTMLHLAEKHSHTHPLAAQCIKYNSYMDDYLSGAQSVDECIELCSQLINLLKKAGFSLHKWTSNNSQVLKSVLPTDTATQSSEKLEHTETSEAGYSFTSNTVKTLGLKWTHTQDTLQLSLPTRIQGKSTKRHILSQISQIFDPIGILAPTTILAKILMQDICKENKDWDSVISPELESYWIEFITQLHHLQVIQIPRWYFTDLPINIYLIGFCDASNKAYGACLYLKATYNQKPSTCTLIMAKSKVAPIKRKLSIPKLELAGAVMLSKISKKFTEAIQNKINIDKVYLFSDSNIILCWIKSPYKHTHDSYTSHRLMQIIDITQSESWYYINTKQNPADLITRGIMPKHLPSCSLWWQGTPWLAQDQNTWPISTSIPEVDTSKQSKQEKIVHTAHIDSNPSNSSYFYDLFCKHSNFTRLIRTIAYMFRFIDNTRNKPNKTTSHLSVSELEKAHNFVISTTQSHSFHKEILYLQSAHTNNGIHSNNIKDVVDIQSNTSKSHHISRALKSSPIRKLNPFIDENQLIRVGGRIQHSDISYNNAHPIILPAKDHITTLIVRHYHLKMLHSGIQSTLHNIRLKYWPINVQIEGILNSRPLSPITDIPNDVTCLTPAHFLVGAPITDLPEPNMSVVVRTSGKEHVRPIHKLIKLLKTDAEVALQK